LFFAKPLKRSQPPTMRSISERFINDPLNYEKVNIFHYSILKVIHGCKGFTIGAGEKQGREHVERQPGFLQSRQCWYLYSTKGSNVKQKFEAF
jgi:hypothetical protein